MPLSEAAFGASASRLTPVDGLYLDLPNTAQIFPEYRVINHSIRMRRLVAQMVINGTG